MKKIILCILCAMFLTGCTHLQTRVPPSALRGNNLIYVSDIQIIPKSVVQSTAGQSLMQVKAILPPEVWAELAKELTKLINDSTTSYFGFRKEMIVINREILIKWSTNQTVDIDGILNNITVNSHTSVFK